MSKGTISHDNDHLGVHIVDVNNTVFSTSCRWCNEGFIDLYIHIHVSRLSRKSILTSKTLIRCPNPAHLPCKTGLFSVQVYLDLSCFKDALFWESTKYLLIMIHKKWVCRWMARSATQFAFGMRKKQSCANSRDLNESAPLLSEVYHQILHIEQWRSRRM